MEKFALNSSRKCFDKLDRNNFFQKFFCPKLFPNFDSKFNN